VPGFLSPLIEPGFFSNLPVQTALVVGGVVAVVSGIVGTFTVMPRQSFAGHSLADIGTAGGSAAFVLGISPALRIRRDESDGCGGDGVDRYPAAAGP